MLHLVKLVYLFVTSLWSLCSSPDWMWKSHKWLCKRVVIHLFHLLICHYTKYLQNNVCQMPRVQCINHDTMQGTQICFRMLTSDLCCLVLGWFVCFVNGCLLPGHLFFEFMPFGDLHGWFVAQGLIISVSILHFQNFRGKNHTCIQKWSHGFSYTCTQIIMCKHLKSIKSFMIFISIKSFMESAFSKISLLLKPFMLLIWTNKQTNKK